MPAELTELQELAKKNGDAIGTLTKSLDGLVEKLSKTPAYGTPDPRMIFGLPNVRTGEDPLTSRGFSFMKMIGLLNGDIQPDEAKIEMDMHNRMHNILAKESGYQYAGLGAPGQVRGKFLAPLASSFFPDNLVSREFRTEMRQVVRAGADGADPHEQAWIRKKMLQAQGFGTKDLSWLNEFTGGSLVPPPEFGELIELLRNKEALVNAGARVVPLPPQGRIQYPRQTSPSTTYWVGENARIPSSDVGTGTVSLQAKKLAVLIRSPNELIRFASPAAEALLRDDMTKSLALGLDMACLEGTGGDTKPLGLLLQKGINTVTSSDARVNGDRLVGNDFYRMVAIVEESNAECEGWIMRPKTLYKAYQLRADAVGQGDGQGPFLFSMIREAADGVKATICGLPVTKSTQVSQVRAKGTATNLTYILSGMFSDCLIGMFGAIEFSSTTQGDTAFQNDQTWVKGILTADFAVRHAAAFALLDGIDTTL